MLTTIIVDDKNTVNIFSEYLEMFGVKVVSIDYDGKEAIKIYKKYRSDILVLDLNMPQYDCIYTLKEIQDLDPNVKIAIIITDSEIFEKLDCLKPTEVFKPFDMKKITTLDKITQAKNTGFTVDNEKNALVSFVITEALLKIGISTINEVGDRLYAKYHCYFSDCLEHPEYLKDVIQELFGNGSTAVIKTIREHLAEFEDQQDVKNFLFVISK
mgnify:CR=1 FL=1